MKTAFEKLGRYHSYIWLAILFDLLASLMMGFLKKFNNIFTIISRADIFESIEKYVGENVVFEFISRYTGVGIGMILVFYLIILFVYILVAFGIPNVMYVINSAVIKNGTGTATNIVIWLLCFLSFAPGLWLTTKMLIMFTLLLGVNIMLMHLAFLFIIQLAMIALYITTLFQSIFNKEAA